MYSKTLLFLFLLCSYIIMARHEIPGGYRFRPTDTELLGFLALFVTGTPISSPAAAVPIAERDLYTGIEPWDIFGDSDDKVKYFFTELKKKSPDNSRYQRRIGDGKGTWKAQDKGKPIFKYDNGRHSGKLVGYKRSLRYENKGSEHDGQWLMKEYYLPEKIRASLKGSLKDYVLCRIKRKLHTDATIIENQSTIARDIGYIIGDLKSRADKFDYPTALTLTPPETSCSQYMINDFEENASSLSPN